MAKKDWELVFSHHPDDSDYDEYGEFLGCEPWEEIYALRKGEKMVERRIYEPNGQGCDLKFYKLVDDRICEEWEELTELAVPYVSTFKEAERIAKKWLNQWEPEYASWVDGDVVDNADRRIYA